MPAHGAGGAEVGGVAAEELCDAAEAEGFDVVADQAAGFGAGVDEDDRGGAAAHGFEAERAGAGEEVEDLEAGEVVADAAREDVEDRLADAVGGGADRVVARASAAPCRGICRRRCAWASVRGLRGGRSPAGRGGRGPPGLRGAPPGGRGPPGFRGAPPVGRGPRGRSPSGRGPRGRSPAGRGGRRSPPGRSDGGRGERGRRRRDGADEPDQRLVDLPGRGADWRQYAQGGICATLGT